MLPSTIKAVYALCVFSFLLIILPNGIGFNFITDIQIWVLVSLVALMPFFISAVRKEKIRFDKPDRLLIVLVIMLSLFPLFDSGSIKIMLGVIVRGFLTFFLPYFAAKYFVKNEKDLLAFLFTVGVAAFVVFLMAMNEYATGESFFKNTAWMLNPDDEWRNSQISYERFGQVRVAASFSQPLYLGTFFGFVGLTSILLLLENKRIKMKAGKAFVVSQALIACLGILLSQSRTSIIAIIVSIVFFIFLNRDRINKANLAALSFVGGFVFLIVAYWFSDYLSDFIRYNVTSEYASNNWVIRIDIASQSVAYLWANFNWIGEGLTRSDSLRWFYENTDLLNGFINQFLRNGVFFFLMYVYLWILAFKHSARRRQVNAWSSVFFFTMVYLCVVNNITALNMQNEILFYIVLGFLFNPSLTASTSSVSNAAISA